jgi:hypothetical protein
MDSVEKITRNDQVLCILIRGSLLPTETTFITPPEYKQQVGFVVYPAGGIRLLGLIDPFRINTYTGLG